MNIAQPCVPNPRPHGRPAQTPHPCLVASGTAMIHIRSRIRHHRTRRPARHANEPRARHGPASSHGRSAPRCAVAVGRTFVAPPYATFSVNVSPLPDLATGASKHSVLHLAADASRHTNVKVSLDIHKCLRQALDFDKACCLELRPSEHGSPIARSVTKS